MAWNTVPVAAATTILESQFDEVRAAIVEKMTASGASQAVLDVTTDGDQALAILSNYRSAVETLIPYFANPGASYAAYNKASCLTAAIGQAEWTAVNGNKDMQIANINELRSVLDLLFWTRKEVNLNGIISAQRGQGSNAVYANAWASASGTYSAGSFGDASAVSDYVKAGFYTVVYSGDGADGFCEIYNVRINPITHTPGAGTIIETKMLVYLQNTGYHVLTSEQGVELASGTVSMDLYYATGFAGSATSFGTAGYANQGTASITLPTSVGGTARYFSMRCDPALPDPGSFDPGVTASGTYAGVGITVTGAPVILNKYSFSYGA